MKKIITILMVLIVSFSNLYSQQLIIKDVSVNNVSIANGSAIEFGSNSQITVRFKVQFIKESSLIIGNVSHVIGTYNSVGTFKQLITPENLFLGEDNVGFQGIWEKTLYASDYGESLNGNYLVAKVTKTTGNPPPFWESNKVYIIKNPILTLNPSSVSVPCGSTQPVTITVNGNNTNNASYTWNHIGWTATGYTQNSITLVPSSPTILPSPVTVVPNFNGQNLPSLNCSVSRPSFTSPATISGLTNVCLQSSSVYTINAGSGNTVTWSSSNPAIASISSQSNNQATINALFQGVVIIKALITNSCGQTTTKEKIIAIGSPVFTFEYDYWEFEPKKSKLCVVSTSNYSLEQQGVTSIVFKKCNSNTTIPKYHNNCVQRGNNSDCIVAIVSNACGSTTYSFDSMGRYANPSTSKNEFNTFDIYPNPTKDFINIDLKDINNNLSQDTEILIELFDLQGKSIKQIKDVTNKVTIDIRDLSKGIYLLKLQIDDTFETQKIVIE